MFIINWLHARTFSHAIVFGFEIVCITVASKLAIIDFLLNHFQQHKSRLLNSPAKFEFRACFCDWIISEKKSEEGFDNCRKFCACLTNCINSMEESMSLKVFFFVSDFLMMIGGRFPKASSSMTSCCIYLHLGRRARQRPRFMGRRQFSCLAVTPRVCTPLEYEDELLSSL